MSKRLLFIAFFVGLLVPGLAIRSATASIISVSGDLHVVARPDTLIYSGATTLNGTPSLAGVGPVIFAEFQSQIVPDFTQVFSGFTGFDVGISTPGTYPSDPMIGTVLLTGLSVDSFMIHYEPGDPSVAYVVAGSVTFDRSFVAVQTSFDFQLRESLLDLPGIQMVGASGLELYTDPLVGDQINLSSDLRTLSFVFHTYGATEDLRIFFNSVPEPGTLTLLALGLVGLGYSRRKHWQRVTTGRTTQ